MNIPFYDSSRIDKWLVEEYLDRLKRVIFIENLIDGDSCRRFEKRFSEYLECNYVIGVANGLDALTISLKALGIKAGDKVGVPAHTFIATWLAVSNIGAVPVAIDVELDGQISLESLSKLEKVNAIIVVHMHGSCGNLNEIQEWCDVNDVWMVEDCAQSHGLAYRGKKVGNWGDIAAFSFYPTKNLFALGDAGAIATNNESIARRVRTLSRYGTTGSDKYKHEIEGYNSRLDTIQANWLLPAINEIDNWNGKRKVLAARYLSNFSGQIKTLRNSAESIFHHFVIYHDERDKLKEYLSTQGIGTEIHYPICPASEFKYPTHLFPNSAKISMECLSLPLNQWMNEWEVDYISEKILNYMDSER